MRRKIWKNLDAKAKSLTIIALMILVALTTAFIINPSFTETVRADFTDYDYYKKITIDSSYVASAQYNIPLLVHDDSGDLQGKVLADASDIAFWDSGNATQYNHEVERYDSGTGELWAWVNITTLSSASDTILYMYYGDNDGSYTVGHNPTSVWDSNYVGVYHMNQSSGTDCWDSTANANHGTYQGDLPTNNRSIIGYAQFFDGVDDYVSLPSGTWVATTVTVSTWHDEQQLGYTRTIYACADLSPTAMHKLAPYNSSNDHDVGYYEGAGWVWEHVDDNERELGKHFLAHAFDGSSNTLRKNNSQISGSAVGTTGRVFTPELFYIGTARTGSADYFGSIDEFRVSDIKRSDNWLDVIYHSTAETSGFLTFGAETSADISVYELRGLTDNTLTWAGTAGSSAWCNSSGDYNEWAEVNMSINSTDNITDVLVYINDLNDSGAFINASNIELFASSDNVSYGSLGSFTDGGSNITVNESTWNDGTMGGNPFSGQGLNNRNQSLFFVFKMTFPVDSPTDIFYSASATDWKIYIGYYT